MTALILPAWPPPASMSVGVVSAANTLTPAFGGDDLELLRKGTRYALTFRMPSMSYVEGLEWDDLTAEGATVVMTIVQPGLDTGEPGSPVVKTGGQAGSTLFITGLTPGYVFRRGQFLSVQTDGQWFLYRIAAPVQADGAGESIVTLRHMLRRSPAIDDVIEIKEPKIEGYVRDLGEWTVGVDHQVGIEFTVRERG